MKQYLNLLHDCLKNGSSRSDRTGTGTLSLFGRQLRFDLEKGFPLLTTKKLHFKSIAHELLWIISGDTNIKYLNENGITIWDEWADESGDLGPIYGKQWRKWPKMVCGELGLAFIDQLTDVIDAIKTNPFSRRHVVSAWNPTEMYQMKLPPCHCFFQLYVNDGKLSCQMYQRSADVFLGVPFNIASYSLLTMMLAQVCGLKPYEFIHTFGDVHLYKNHTEQAALQIAREPRTLPKMYLNSKVVDIDDFKYEDFRLEGYNPHPHIKAEISV